MLCQNFIINPLSKKCEFLVHSFLLEQIVPFSSVHKCPLILNVTNSLWVMKLSQIFYQDYVKTKIPCVPESFNIL